ncbi:hypothetical protein [Bacillus glycinifermentans]|uniref:hypothetical protein n=1 Tax=Bacillus glycinifermentans TaxID=1664069 RepID=UPI0022E49098|nr:hypothetical protein [Bacillus glycinifermentans]
METLQRAPTNRKELIKRECEKIQLSGRVLKTVEHKLLENEAVNNLPLGILYGLKRRPDVDAVLLTAENDEGIQLAAVMASGDLILAGEESGLEAAGILAAYLEKAGIRPPGVTGRPALAKAFVEASKRRAAVKMRQKMYRIDHVNDISFRSGHLRKADQQA